MAEPGGPTTQSGIYYQNTISALYLGALLDLRPPQYGTARVVAVRVEAPEDIDDTVVTHADGSTLYIQAKENLALNGDAWNKFWAAARKQAAKSRVGGDRFRLIIGTLSAELEVLRETLERADGKEDIEEWRNALNLKQKRCAKLIMAALSLSDNDALDVLKRTRVEFITLTSAVTTRARDWMPHASEPAIALHSRLRDCCGGAARVRHTFRAGELSEMLFKQFAVRIFGSQSDGLHRYCETIAIQVNQIGVPGTSISVQEDELLVWPTIVKVGKSGDADFEDEDPRRSNRYAGEEVDLRQFPTSDMKFVIVESGAGHGKSTILRAIVRRLATATSYVPALIHAEALPNHNTIQEYLNTEYNDRYEVSIDWTALCEQGRAVVLIDGVDELNDSDRAKLINMVGLAAANFSHLSLSIGARDAAMTSFPPQFQLCRMQRLDHNQMVEMLQSYLRTRGEFEIRTIVQHVNAYNELELLCRIPLFLAIFAATLPKSGAIPTGRTEVLERYIMHVLSPDRHKGVRKFVISKTQLRRGAEAIAVLALERNEAAIPEAAVRTCASKVLGDPNGDDCVDALVQHGMLERRGSRVAFCIPTVQEYLAGCVLAEAGRLGSDDWLQNVYRRPWAQAIQFAVEKIDSADGPLGRQLKLKDDLFYTSLRLIARCIVNGASVSAGLKDAVASRLAHALLNAGHGTTTKISQLIADGFCKPMHPDIRNSVVTGKQGSFWRPRIIARAQDVTVTLDCLRSALANEDIRELWNPDWFLAVKPVMKEALFLLLARARSEPRGTLAAQVIAQMLYQMRGEPSVDWEEISNDDSLPIVVRVAAKFGLRENEDGLQADLIEAAFADSVYGSLWESFNEAYLSTSWWKQHLRELFRLDSKCGRGNAFRYVEITEERLTEQIELLSEIALDPLTHPDYVMQLQSLLGSLGLDDFAKASTNALATANIDQVYNWIRCAVYFPLEIVKRGIAIISDRALSNADRVSILDELYDLGMRKPVGSRRSVHRGGPFATLEQPGEVAETIAASADRLLKGGELDESQIRTLLFILAKHGSESAYRRLKLEVEAYLDSHDSIDTDEWNSWFAHAIGLIYQPEREVDVSRLWQILKKGGDLPMHQVVETIVQKEGLSGYNALVDYVNLHPKSTVWGAVYFYLEQNAERKGLNVQYANGKLQVSTV